LTTIYSELIEAAGAEFLPQAEGEPDGHYLRRLVLAVSKASDNDWEHLSKEAQDWYNAQAIRVKAQQDPEECPGFAHEPCIEEILRFTAEEQYLLLNGTPEGRARAAAWRKEFGIPEPTVTGPDEVEMENRIKDAATPFVGRKIDDEMVEELTNVVDAVVDAGWPIGPELPKASSNDVAHQDSPLHFEGSPAYFPGYPGEAIVDAVKEYLTTAPKRDSPHIVSGTIPLETDGEIVDAGALHDAIDAFMVQSPKHTASDAVRALVMQHQDWNQAQILRELEAQGRAVSLGTIATVRSMTLATIAVAKGLGKWVEG